MLIESQTFDRKSGPPTCEPDTVFCYVEITGVEPQGSTFDGALIRCTLERVDWYWAFFNTALVAYTVFKDCVFRGASFRGVDFVECTFDGCRFIRDNLDIACTFADCRFTECNFEECMFEPENRPGREPLFGDCRFYGCHEAGTKGTGPLF